MPYRCLDKREQLLRRRFRCPLDIRAIPYRISATVIAVTALSFTGTESTHCMTFGSGAGRMIADRTSVSKTIIQDSQVLVPVRSYQASPSSIPSISSSCLPMRVSIPSESSSSSDSDNACRSIVADARLSRELQIVLHERSHLPSETAHGLRLQAPAASGSSDSTIPRGAFLQDMSARAQSVL